MLATASLKNNRMDIGPSFDVPQFVSLREREILSKLDFCCFLIKSEKTLRCDGSGVEDARKLGSQKMALFSVELRVRVNLSIEVACEHVLDLSSLHDVLWGAVWKLDPVMEQVRGHPEDKFVDAIASRL